MRAMSEAVSCRWCGQSVRPCVVKPCRGWGGEPCTGWMHWDLFHGCEGGRHCAEVAVSAPTVVVP